MTEAPPAGRRIRVPVHLRWGDLDAYNHINNTSLVKLLEEARVRAFWRPDPGEETFPTAVLVSGVEHGTLTVVARQEIEYLRPVPYQRRPLDVQMWFGAIGASSIEVCYEVWSLDGADAAQELYARSTAVIVMVDVATGRPKRLTDEQRIAWAPYIGDPITYPRRR